MMHGSVEISSRKRPAAIRSGRVRHEHVLADPEAAALLQVAGDELRGPRRDRRAQDQRVARLQQRQQVVDRGAHLAQVALDVRERRRPERDHDVVGAGGVGGAIGQVHAPAGGDPLEQLLGAGLGERHPPGTNRVEHLGVGVDARARAGRGRRSTAPAANRLGRGRLRRSRSSSRSVKRTWRRAR